jgi:O-antigen ligase
MLPKTIIPTIALVASFAIGPVAPEAGNILFLAAGGVALALMWPEAKEQLGRPIIWMPLLGLVLIALAYGISAGLAGLAGLMYFVPVLAIWPLVTLLSSTNIRELGLLLGILALCGVSGAAVMAINEIQTTDTHRAGFSVANPIHFADVALMVGFLTLIGMAFLESRWRLLFLAGPPMAIIAVALSGTRGAVVAAVVMGSIAAASAIVLRLVSRRLVLGGLVGLVVIGAIGLALGVSQVPGIARIVGDIAEILTQGLPNDSSTDRRLQMFLGGFRAFMESPIVGHGPLAFTEVAISLSGARFRTPPHLHNDLIDMAASAGILGLFAYFLLVFAPVVEVLRSPPSAARSCAAILAFTLVGGFFTMGLTNAMFGILTVTSTFAAICVVVGMLADGRVAGDLPAAPSLER